MSIYSTKGKGWRFDFTLKGNRYTGASASKPRQKSNRPRQRESRSIYH